MDDLTKTTEAPSKFERREPLFKVDDRGARVPDADENGVQKFRVIPLDERIAFIEAKLGL